MEPARFCKMEFESKWLIKWRQNNESIEKEATK